MTSNHPIAVLALTLFLASTTFLPAADWPMWRHDSGRGAWSPEALPDSLHLQWVRELPAPAPAWPETQGKLQYDSQAEPVLMGELLFVPSSRNDSITALSTRTGEERWRFHADGPIRFSPVALDGRLFFGSDDGHLYALNAEDGSLLWKIKGGPPQRRLLLGNQRLISSWPARGGVVAHEGRLYFAASIWPFMGIFIQAVDPETGVVVWTNSGDGTNFTVQPHNAPSFAGLVPQGHLAAIGKKLIVPGGRSTPGVFDIDTGKQLFFKFDKKTGDHRVGATGDLHFTGEHAYLLEDGTLISGGAAAVFNAEEIISSDPKAILSRSSSIETEVKETVDKRGKKIRTVTPKYRQLYRTELSEPAPGPWFLRAGDRLYSGGTGTVAAYDIDGTKPAWRGEVTGQVRTMLAGDGRLFVLTGENQLHCFGASKPAKVPLHAPKKITLAPAKDAWAAKASSILARPGAAEGYALTLGIGSGRLIDELLLNSRLHLIAIDPDAAKVEKFRRRMSAAGLYGKRVAAIASDLAGIELPPYLCNLIVAEEKQDFDLDTARALFSALRPYGGLAALELSDKTHAALEKHATGPGFENALVKRSGTLTTLARPGALPDTDDWTHQYANAAQTVVSRDNRVKAPFGVLWFGGPSHEGILPRHGHGPSPQVAGGRLFIEGPDLLRAVDVYTGRLLWERELKGFGEYYDTTAHFPGAGEIGSNYVSLPDRVYALNDKLILELDSATGKTLREYTRKLSGDTEEESHWGSLRVSGDYLVTTAAPVALDSKSTDALKALPVTRFGSGSRSLEVYDRRNGKLLWKREAQFNFRHNNIAVSDDRIYCIDRLSNQKEQALSRRGLEFKGTPVLHALDLATGKTIWERDEEVFGTFLNYSAEHDVLLQAGSAYRDRAKDEITSGMMALRASDGKVLWHDDSMAYGGPCLLWRDKILTNGVGGFAIELLTGKKTGWDYKREYGCNTAVGSENLLTFRSGAAGFFDLANDSGTGNLGGFKSSCTANLIPANGVLNAPDYTRTCTCSYQNQTSLALVHMPAAEFWTFGGKPGSERIGVNFGAPGDRRSPEGTLFLEYPLVGGASADLEIRVEGETMRYRRIHTSLMAETRDTAAWVGASAVEGASLIVLETGKEKAPARLKLYFAESGRDVKPGDRVFELEVQGQPAGKTIDLAANPGPGKSLLVETPVVTDADGTLKIELTPRKGSLATLLSGIELTWK